MLPHCYSRDDKSYSKRYFNKCAELENLKSEMLGEIVTLFSKRGNKPIFLGNMVYSVCTFEGKVVPAYCYLSDYKATNGGCQFLPIYDEFGNGDFGWRNFDDVARIFDTIKPLFGKVWDIDTTKLESDYNNLKKAEVL